QRLEQAPRIVSVTFDQGVKAFPDSIVVRSANGTIFSRVTRSGADPHVMLVPLRALPRGAYTVRWHALSSDGHVGWRLDVRGTRGRAAADRGVRRVGADADRGSRALGVLRRADAARGRARVQAAGRSGPAPSACRGALLQVGRARRDRRARGRN